MKKKTVGLLLCILLLPVLILTACCTASPIRLADAQPALALGDGVVWMMENRDRSACLYRVDTEGRVDFLYQERAGGNRSLAFAAACANAEAAYLLRLTGERTSGEYSGWEVARLELETGAVQTISRGGRSALDAPSAIMLDEGKLIISGIAVDGRAQVLALAEEKAPELLHTASPSGQSVYGAAYAASGLYCLLDDGSVARFDADGALVSRQTGAHTLLAAGEGGALLHNDSTGESRFLTGRTNLPVFQLEPQAHARAAAALSAQDAVLLVEDSGAASLLWMQGGRLQTVDTLRVPLILRLRVFFARLTLPTVGVFTAAALLLAAASVAWRSKRVAVRASAAAICGIVLAFSLLGGGLVITASRSMQSTRLSQTAYWGTQRAQSLQTEIGDELFSNLDVRQADRLRGLLAAERLDDGQGRMTVTYELMQVSSDGGIVLLSPRYPTGTNLRAVFPAVLTDAALSAAQTGGTGTLAAANGQTAACAVNRVSPGDDSLVLVTTATMADVGTRTDTLTRTVLGLCLLSALFTALFTTLLLLRLMRPVGRLERRMRSVSEGDFTPEDYPVRDDDIGLLQRTLEEMCLSLAIKDYDTRCTIASYYRFVPRGMDALLNRAGVSEVSCGDVATVQGAVGLVCVGRREEICQRLDNGQFMRFVNRCFSTVHAEAAAAGGVLLSGDFDIADLKYLFRNGARDAFRFGLALAGKHAETKDEIPSPEYFTLFHQMEFLYGVAGSDDKAFPFLSSTELGFLSSLSDRFHSLGVCLVMTEAFKSNLPPPFASRYIGFVSSPDGRHTFKLYELLDGYNDRDRQIILAYDARLQEAIHLFYKNDFYLARNSFSTILKAYPDDGVARWYIFACEYFFNSEDLQKINYNLFGIEQ